MNNFKRLHPAAVFVSFMLTLKELLIPIVIAFFVGGTTANRLIHPQFLILIILIGAFLYGFFRWLTFRYAYIDGELQVKQGVLFKKNRYVRKEKIASIDIVSGFLQRMFGLVKVKIETAGGGNIPEIELIAVQRKEANYLRNVILLKSEGEESETQPQTVWQLNKQRLFVVAMTSSSVGIVLSAFLAFLTQIEGILPDTIYEVTFGYFASLDRIFLVLGIFILFLLAWIISTFLTIVKYGGFQVFLEGDKLLIRRGLLEQRQLTIDRRKVTAIRIVSNLFRQPFGYVTVYVESAGGGANDEQMSTILLPLIKKRELKVFFQEVLPQFSFERGIKHIPKRAWIRYQIRILILPIIISIAAFVIFPYGYALLFLLPFFSMLGYWQFKDAGYGMNDSFIWLSFRKISHISVIVPQKRIESIQYIQSVPQMRVRLANLQLAILSSIKGKTFSVRDMCKRDADVILSWIRKGK